MMNNIILQPHGIGDVIFCQTLINSICNGPIIWPVLPKFIDGLKIAYPNILFIPTGIIPINYETIKRETILNGNRIIPIRYADQIQKVPYRFCMRSKYDLYGMDYRIWTQTPFQRNKDKEAQLYSLMVNGNEPYCIVNQNFTSQSGKKVRFHVPPNIKIINMEEIEGYSIFDWSLIIENAEMIYTVSTSIIYILELLDLKASKVRIFKRIPDESNHKNYDYLLTKSVYELD